MAERHDPAALDAILRGVEDEQTERGWRDLVTKPGGGEAWRAAVARRGRVDRVAEILALAPWTAPILRLLARRRRGRTIGSPLVLTWQIGVPALDGLLDGLESRQVGLSWGRSQLLRMAVGEQVELSLPVDTGLKVRLWYRVADDEGLLLGRAWRLEAGEAPVLIVATVGPGGETMESAMEQADAVAAVLLVEE